MWIDGHRGPAWSNNYPLVAYLESDGEWYEERHFHDGPLVGVVAWKPLSRFSDQLTSFQALSAISNECEGYESDYGETTRD